MGIDFIHTTYICTKGRQLHGVEFAESEASANYGRSHDGSIRGDIKRNAVGQRIACAYEP